MYILLRDGFQADLISLIYNGALKPLDNTEKRAQCRDTYATFRNHISILEVHKLKE